MQMIKSEGYLPAEESDLMVTTTGVVWSPDSSLTVPITLCGRTIHIDYKRTNRCADFG